MAFDGIVIAKTWLRSLVTRLPAARSQRSRRPSAMNFFYHKELPGRQKRLLLSVNAKSPAGISTDTNKQGPMTAPNFCMLLRKHIGSGRIVSVSQQRVWNAVFILRSNI